MPLRGIPDAEIIAVGSELLTTSRMDTNSVFIAGHLNDLGVELRRKSCIGDDRDLLASAVREALSRVEILILTGGLGPTEDDVTRDAVALALGRELELRTEIVEWIEARFRKFGRKMAEINRRQAYIVQGGEALPNPNGTAPGQWIELDGRVVMLLPGPPPELNPMFLSCCLPRLKSIVPVQVIRSRMYRVAGIGESDLDQMIAPVYKPYANPVTTILAKPGDVEVHLRARASTMEEAERLLAEVAPKIEEKLGERIYSTGGDPLEAVIGKMLRARSAMLAVAESCTGGLLGGRITDVPGSSDYFAGGFLVYNDRMKKKLLGVPEDMLAEHTAVSEPVARAMAEGARERTAATYALSVTGYAEPDNGLVWIGLAGPEGVEARRLQFPGGRERVRSVAVQTALNMLRLRLRQPLA